MSFRDDFPEYKKYEDNNLSYREIPPGVASAFKGLILRETGSSTNRLKSFCNNIASRIPCEPTQNWGRDWLVGDLDLMLDQLANKKMHKFMDFAMDLVRSSDDSDILEDLNDIFEEYDFGYRIVIEHSCYGDEYYWELRDDPAFIEETVASAVKETTDLCNQTKVHLRQAREHLKKIAGNDRAIKDALRDCLSAMEALVKDLSGETDFRKSISSLRKNIDWGPAVIIKEGLGVWDRVHDLYPDVRHGNPNQSAITVEEGLFWIDKLMAYVNYLSRRKNNKSIF